MASPHHPSLEHTPGSLGAFALPSPQKSYQSAHDCTGAFQGDQLCRAALISPLQGNPGWHRAPPLASASLPLHTGLTQTGTTNQTLSIEITTFQPFTSLLPQCFLPFAILNWSINSCLTPCRGLERFSCYEHIVENVNSYFAEKNLTTNNKAMR